MKMRRARRSRIVHAIAALGALILLASCATTQQATGTAPTAEPTKSPASASQAPRVYYAGVEGLKVYSEASAFSKVVGTLSLHEKVVRMNLERGYAFVESTKSEVKGWVDNAQLIWRLPAASGAGAPTNVEAQPEEPEAPAPEEPTPTAAPEPTPTAAVFPTIVPAPTPAPREMPTPRSVSPSIFNPY
jgi:hypothetical protein